MINNRSLNYKLLISKLINTEYIKCFFSENSSLTVLQECVLSKYFDKFNDLIIFFYTYLKSPQYNSDKIEEISFNVLFYKDHIIHQLYMESQKLYDNLFNIIYLPIIDDIFNTIIDSMATSKNKNNSYKLFNECINKLFMFFDLASLLVSGLKINNIMDFPDEENIEIFIIPEQKDPINFIDNYLNTLLTHKLTKQKKLNIIINTNYVNGNLTESLNLLVEKYQLKFHKIETIHHLSEELEPD